jgi:hypothetical protein
MTKSGICTVDPALHLSSGHGSATEGVVTTGGLWLHSLKSSIVRQQSLRNGDLYGSILGFVPAAMSELEIYQHCSSLRSSHRLFYFCAHAAATT